MMGSQGNLARREWHSEAISESCSRPHDPVVSFAEPHHTLGPLVSPTKMTGTVDFHKGPTFEWTASKK
jgi:hypothetical protein